MSGSRVEIRQLRKSYDHGGQKLEVLRGIDLMIGAGEMVAVVGSSGAGKSTLLRHLLGTLDQPTAGSVVYDGVEVTRMPQAAMADFRNRTIGFVFQFHHLLPEFTAVENCAMPALIAGLSRADANGRAKKLLDRVGLGHRMTHRPGELSGGEQQRVALARALVMEPRVLLADEPTGNLDTHTGEDMHKLVVELNRDFGMTLVVVTHNPDFAARLPRRVHMVDGRLDDSAPMPPSSSLPGHA